MKYLFKTALMGLALSTSLSASTLLAATQSSERKTLDLALSAINKQYGDGTLMRMGDATKMTVSTVSTGSCSRRRAGRCVHRLRRGGSQ